MAQPWAALRGWWTTRSDLLSRLGVNVIALAVYRLAHFIPSPGVDASLLPDDFALGSDMFRKLFHAVEAPANISTLGLGPYIEASILISVLLTPWVLTALKPYIPFGRQLAQWKDQGREGQAKIKMLIKCMALVAALVGGYIKGLMLLPYMPVAGPHAALVTSLNLTAGTFIQLWLADLVSHRGLGEGITYLICLNMISGFSRNLAAAAACIRAAPPGGPALAAVAAGTLTFTVAFLLLGAAVRHLPVTSYRSRAVTRKSVLPEAARQALRRLETSTRMRLPLRLAEGGIMPIIFSLTAIQGVSTAAAWAGAAPVVAFLSDHYLPVHALLIWQFSLSSLAASANPASISEYLSKSSAGITSVPPGRPTMAALRRECLQVRFVGGVALAGLAVAAELFDRWCAATIGAQLQITNLLLLTAFVAGAMRQTASLLRGPRAQAALDRERSLLSLSHSLALPGV